MEENYKMIAKTFRGLEDVLAEEIRNLGGQKVIPGIRNVSFYGDKGFMYKANFCLRTALCILKPILEFKARDEQQFYRNLYNFNWEDYLDDKSTFVISSVVNSPIFKNSHYVSLRAKDAIVDKIRDELGDRPSIDKTQPDLKIHVHINREKVTILSDSSGEALFKRGYRFATQEAPINEVLAAGLLKLAQWDGRSNFIDPMCGSGTFLIEAVMMAMNIPPQHKRRYFQFMRWKDYDEHLFELIKTSTEKRIRDSAVKYLGFDISSKAINDTSKNVRIALLDDYIELYKESFFKVQKPEGPAFIIFNPPYGERLQIPVEDFYKQIGDTLKQNFKNTTAWIITSDLDGIKKVGLKASRRIPIQNGALECRLVKYEIYEGSKKNNKNSVGF